MNPESKKKTKWQSTHCLRHPPLLISIVPLELLLSGHCDTYTVLQAEYAVFDRAGSIEVQPLAGFGEVTPS